MWTADNRPRYNRDKLRYPSDLAAGGYGTRDESDEDKWARGRERS